MPVRPAFSALPDMTPSVQHIGEQALTAARALLTEASVPPAPDTVSLKSPNDYLTTLDVAIERRIGAVLRAAYPKHGIVGEEVFREADPAGFTWYVDPIDGTRNFVAGRPDIAVSLALYEGDVPVAAFLLLPHRSLTLSAVRERSGLWVNGQPVVPPSPPARLADALIGLPGDFRAGTRPPLLAALFQRLSRQAGGVRITGALAYDLGAMALGELHGRLSTQAKVVDVAAGAFLLSRAGGVVTDGAGRPWVPRDGPCVAAATPALHGALMDLLAAEPLAADFLDAEPL